MASLVAGLGMGLLVASALVPSDAGPQDRRARGEVRRQQDRRSPGSPSSGGSTASTRPGSSANLFYLYMNTERPLFKNNVKLRQAVNLRSTDRRCCSASGRTGRGR